MSYDIIIIGAGPAGIFTALELVKQRSDLKILMLDKGPAIDRRVCPLVKRKVNCTRCDPCGLLCGWGGAGAFSDGKLTLSPEVGGQLTQYLPEETVAELIGYVDGIYRTFGAPEITYGLDGEEVKALAHRAAIADLKLVPSAIRHMGTEVCYEVLLAMQEHLAEKVEFRPCTEVTEILTEDGKAVGVRTEDGKILRAERVVAAPGREGSRWLVDQARKLGIPMVNNPVDVGVRVEVPAAAMEPITRIIYEPKLIFYGKTFDDKVRTFCVCPYGEVVTEYNDGITTVNGHSYSTLKTRNTNFALLVSTQFTEPFHEPIKYGRYLASLANMLGDGVIVQRLGDLESGRRSTKERIARGLVRPTLASATPGDLSFVLPYRHLTDLVEMLHALDKLAPGVGSRHTLLYGVEVKFYSARLTLTPGLETPIRNLYAIGDGAGVTRGLVQASASGVVVAREILGRS